MSAQTQLLVPLQRAMNILQANDMNVFQRQLLYVTCTLGTAALWAKPRLAAICKPIMHSKQTLCTVYDVIGKLGTVSCGVLRSSRCIMSLATRDYATACTSAKACQNAQSIQAHRDFRDYRD